MKKGQGLVEYALVLVLIAVVIIAIVTLVAGGGSEPPTKEGWTHVEGTESVFYKTVTIKGRTCTLITRTDWKSIGISCP